MTGVRLNEGKPCMSLLPQDTLVEVAKIMTKGLEKYEPRNWEKGMDWSTCQSSLLRHVAEWSQGVDVDPETGCLHIAHAMCNAMFLTAYQLRKVGNDDRSKTKTSLNE